MFRSSGVQRFRGPTDLTDIHGCKRTCGAVLSQQAAVLSPFGLFHRCAVSNLETLKQAAKPPETLKPLNIYISENQCYQWEGIVQLLNSSSAAAELLNS
jgi:hypothetical protein